MNQEMLQNRHYKKRGFKNKLRFQFDIEVDQTVMGIDQAHFAISFELAKCYKLKESFKKSNDFLDK
jgi:hypothetical protein